GDVNRANQVEQALAVFDTDEDKCNYLRTYLDFLKPDISNKRRRIGDSNEELGAWNALKSGTKENQFLRLSKEASYILGDDDKGSNPPALFIRDCYIHLSEIILEDDNIRRLRITGNPGIGKTFFGYYLLHLLAMRNKTVIYHKCNKTPILFSEEAVYHIYQDNIYEFNDFLMKRDVWYIVDGREPSDIHAKTILICSPQKHYYHKFDKLGTIIRYMPVWSYVEIKKCKDKLFPDLNQELVQSLYNKWGGIPRYTLYYALNDKLSIEFLENFLGDVAKIYNHGKTFLTFNEEKENLSKQILQIKDEYNDLIKEKDKTIAEFKESIAIVKLNNISLTNNNNDLNSKMSEKDAANDKLRKETIEYQNLYSTLVAKYNDLVQEYNNLKEELIPQIAMNVGLTETNIKYEKQYNQYVSQLNRLKKHNSELQLQHD
ncbi:442_t:CDS:2, partial [Entrophospora sp. SA101]